MTDPRPNDPPTRDPALDAAWHAYSVETPPPALDAKILAAAHREAHSRPRPLGDDDDTLAEAREPSRWWWGLAAAATIGAVAFGIVQLAPPHVATESMVASDVPQESAKQAAKAPIAPPAPAPAQAPAPATAPEISTPDPLPPPPRGGTSSPQASAPRATPARRDVSPPLPTEDKRASERQLMKTEAGRMTEKDAPQPYTPAPILREVPEADAAVAPKPFPASPESPATMKMMAPERRQAPAPQTVAPPVAPPAPAAAGASAPRLERSNEGQRSAAGATATAIPPPEEYVVRIVTLHAAGKLDDAANLLNRFRVAYADADKRLPPELRAWAATVERRP